MATPQMTPPPQAETNLPDVPQTPPTTVISDTSQWSDERAATVAMLDFQRAEAYRTQNHDRRFKVDYQLYTGWRQKKTWEGTRIPRASLPVFLVNEQIESALPSWIDAVIGDPDFFACQPLPGTGMDQARAVKELILSQLRDLSPDQQFISFRETIRRMKKSDLLHGAGVMEFGWMVKPVEKLTLLRETIPQHSFIQHPMAGPLLVPNGQFFDRIIPQIDRYVVRKPVAQAVAVEDFYIDPNCPSPNPQEGGYCATRNLYSIEYLKQIMGGDHSRELGFNLPPDIVLKQLATYKSTSMGDTDKQYAEAYRGMQYQPSIDQSVDPNLARVEVIRYFRKNRIVWMLGRKWCAYNQPNEYGILPFLNCCGVDLPGRFYGISYSDLLEGDQKVIASILEARLDELSMMIHPPLLRKSGSITKMSTYRKLRPGVEWEVDTDGKVTDAVAWMPMANVTAQAITEVQAAENRSQKTTGITDLVALGAPGGQGNSANRTATGIRTQQNATAGRIKYAVVNFEDQVLQPFLYIMHGMNKRFSNPNEAMKILGQDGQLLEFDPLDVINADVHFQMLGSTKMKTKEALAGGGLQFLIEGILNPQVLQMAAQQGLKPDFNTIVGLFSDALGMPYRALYTQMTPQEMQALKQPSPDQMLRAQMQQQRTQAQSQLADQNADTELLKVMLQQILKNPEVVLSLLEAEGLDNPLKLMQSNLKMQTQRRPQ